jgi:small-conductance mechanosensitive channel
VNTWPVWIVNLLWTVGTIGGVYLVGYTLRVVIGARLVKLARRTEARWDDVLLSEIKRRVPLWSLLVGLYLSLGRWDLAPRLATVGERVLSAVGVASVSFAVAAVLSRLVVDYGARAAVPVSGLTQNLVRITVTVLGGLIIIRSFGYDITPMLTVLGVGGLTVALALQEPLSNLFAGLFVSLAGQIRIGDYVRLDSGAEGFVVDLNWRSTRLRQAGDNVIEVPNSKLAQAIVTNFSQPALEMMTTLDVVVEASSDLGVVERTAGDVVRSVVRDVPGAVPESESFVRFGAITEFGVRVTIALRVRSFADQVLVRHELIKRLHQGFAAAGVALADARGPRARPGRSTPA